MIRGGIVVINGMVNAAAVGWLFKAMSDYFIKDSHMPYLAAGIYALVQERHWLKSFPLDIYSECSHNPFQDAYISKVEDLAFKVWGAMFYAIVWAAIIYTAKRDFALAWKHLKGAAAIAYMMKSYALSSQREFDYYFN